MNSRIRDIRLKEKLSQTAFADRLGMTRSMISNLELGLVKVSDHVMKLLSSEFHINRHWLETGEGEMYDSTPADLISQLAAEHNLGPGGVSLLRVAVRIFDELGPEALDTIIRETIPEIMRERGLGDPAALAAQRAVPLDSEDQAN